MRYVLAIAIALTATTAFAAEASASQLVARNAKGARLAVNGSGVALVTYQGEGRVHHTLAWGAINARPPTRGRQQVAFKLDYSGGGRGPGSWRGFRTRCAPYDGPELQWMVAGCRAPDGSYWALQKWQRALPNFGRRPTRHQASGELHLSHWSGDLPEFVVKLDWVQRRFDNLYGWLKYRDTGVYGFKSTRFGSPLDSWGRNIFVDTFNSRYGRGWKRENSFLTHRPSGAFCYGFVPHGSRPSGKGEAYRATVIGPGVTPILFWRSQALGAYDQALDEAANEEQAALFPPNSSCRAN